MLLVTTILGQVQAHLADDVPRRMARAQPARDGTAVSADLVDKGPLDVRPPGGDPVGVDILAAGHGRHRGRQPLALVGRAVDLDAARRSSRSGMAQSRSRRPGRSRGGTRAEERAASRARWRQGRAGRVRPPPEGRETRARAEADRPSLAGASSAIASASSAPDGRMATRIVRSSGLQRDGEPGVHRQHLARDVGRGVGGQEDGNPHELVGTAEALQRDPTRQLDQAWLREEGAFAS